MATPSTGNHGMTWKDATIFLIAETTSLGVLALPATAKNVGLLPVLGLLVLYTSISLYTGYVVYQFTLRFPQTHSFADGLELVFGRVGRWLGHLMQLAYMLFVMAAHIIGFAAMLTLETKGTTCKLEYKSVAAGLYFIATIPRNLRANKTLYITSCVSIVIASIIAMAGVGTSPQSWAHAFIFLPSSMASIAKSSETISTIIVASMAQIAYPSIMSEMRQPRDFRKALVIQQILTLVFSMIVVTVFYLYAGQEVVSPALGSAFGPVGQVAYAIASPSIVAAGVIAALIAAKASHSQLWRVLASKGYTKEYRRWKKLSWHGANILLISLSFLLAISIPIFAELFSLMGALFGTLFALVFPASFWFYMSLAEEETAREPPQVVTEPVNGEVLDEESAKELASTSERRNVRNPSMNSDLSSEASVDRVSTSQSKIHVKWSIRDLHQKLWASGKTQRCAAVLNLSIFVIGLALCVLGTYGSALAISTKDLSEMQKSC